jgi:hypothetical protein
MEEHQGDRRVRCPNFRAAEGTFLALTRVGQSYRLADSAAYLTAPIFLIAILEILGVLLILRGSPSFREETNHLVQR